MPRLVVPSLFLPRNRSRVARHAQPARVDAAALEHVELGEEHRGVDDDAVRDHRHDPRVEHPARRELELEHLAVDDERVPRIVPALVADDERGLLGEVVGELPLRLVAPLGPDDHCAGHRRASRAGVQAGRQRRAIGASAVTLGRA
jgi:hypothetical protein